MQHSQWCGQLRKAALKLSETYKAVSASGHMYLYFPVGKGMFRQRVCASLLGSILSWLSIVGLFARYSRHLLKIYQWPGTWLFRMWVYPGGCRLAFGTHLILGKGRQTFPSLLGSDPYHSHSFAQVSSLTLLTSCPLNVASWAWIVLLAACREDCDSSCSTPLRSFVLSYCSWEKKPKIGLIQVLLLSTASYVLPLDFCWFTEDIS